MTYDIHITIGHNVGKHETHDIQKIAQAVTNVFKIKAFTAFECFGMWKGVPERSTRIEINDITEPIANMIENTIPILADNLEQCEIMFERFESNTQFIEKRNAQDLAQTIRRSA